MSTKNAWADLPNATHIDAVLAHMKAHPEKWNFTWDAAWNFTWNAAWNAARSAAWSAARDAARGAARGAARSAAWSAVLALIAWDDCAPYLYMDPIALETIIKLNPENHAAVLLLPACRAMK